MIASNHDWRVDLTALHQIVHGNSKLGPFTIAEPANARRQTLEMDSLFGQFHPALESFVFWKEFEGELISPRDVGRLAAQRNPSKWPLPFTEQWPNIFRNEP